MDENNISNLKGDAPQGCKAKILLLGDFDPEGDRIIRDPYYVSFFKSVLFINYNITNSYLF